MADLRHRHPHVKGNGGQAHALPGRAGSPPGAPTRTSRLRGDGPRLKAPGVIASRPKSPSSFRIRRGQAPGTCINSRQAACASPQTTPGRLAAAVPRRRLRSSRQPSHPLRPGRGRRVLSRGPPALPRCTRRVRNRVSSALARSRAAGSGARPWPDRSVSRPSRVRIVATVNSQSFIRGNLSRATSTRRGEHDPRRRRQGHAPRSARPPGTCQRQDGGFQVTARGRPRSLASRDPPRQSAQCRDAEGLPGKGDLRSASGSPQHASARPAGSCGSHPHRDTSRPPATGPRGQVIHPPRRGQLDGQQLAGTGSRRRCRLRPRPPRPSAPP